MTFLRALAIVACLVAARRRVAFAVVAAELGAESAGGELSARLEHAALSALAWSAPQALSTFAALSLSRRGSTRSAALACALTMAAAALCPSNTHQLLTCAASCAFALVALASRTRVDDAARVAALLLLAGNVAGSLLALFVGIESAYDDGIVLTSNSVTHAAILGLAAWTATTR